MPLRLPSTSFCELTAHKLRNPQLVWQRDTAFEPGPVYCLPLEDDDIYVDKSATRIVHADIYGGASLGNAGGSGRCVIDNDVQIKGAGVTPLVSRHAGRAHSNGIMSMREAALEAVWSGIFARILPYGAVPTLAIVATGETVPAHARSADHSTGDARALTWRPFVARPGHFIRNKYFSYSFSADGLSGGAVVSRNAVRELPRIFERELPHIGRNGSTAGYINDCLAALCTRYSEQVAEAFAKRLFHGALSCSNIALSGAFIDFGTTTYSRAYMQLTNGPGFYDQWEQQVALETALLSMRDAIQRYGEFGHGLVSSDELSRQFRDAWASASQAALLKMSGIPADWLARHAGPEADALYYWMRAVYRSNGGGPVSLWPGEHAAEPQALAAQVACRADLNDALRRFAAAPPGLEQQCVAGAIEDRALRAGLTEALLALEQRVLLSHRPERRAQARQLIRSRMRRLNQDLDFLMRGDTQGSVPGTLTWRFQAMQHDPAGLKKLIDDTVARAVHHLSDHDGADPDAGVAPAIQAVPMEHACV